MKYLVRLICGVVLSGTLISAAIAAEGTVISSLNTDAYTYVEIFRNNQNAWIVGPVVAVKPGNQVKFEEGAIMKNFYSQQLLRTFPEVMFVGEITVAAEK
ncbi:MAG: hypothetical protein CO125_03490 [Hydrogenophilales bacterium CG_4_9_14_3_um_filter_59_35]|nr:MAG: hypothetical protein COW70_01310 [Hydrogenophilales bacterium CG18_big_fil_WC_8_21_14_2_50_58_12]PIX99744.1 MAG: hypothetical protein COZ23_10340 [Hydrogenophilales bacterium CG_4_10_14_3_um_filter_58_23]PJB07910.1 MAG: hypothetical protein CO125_03490 [Hydrogenophilales bacterium CG_4_9_14_3_um_filter_59_35]